MARGEDGQCGMGAAAASTAAPPAVTVQPARLVVRSSERARVTVSERQTERRVGAAKHLSPDVLGLALLPSASPPEKFAVMLITVLITVTPSPEAARNPQSGGDQSPATSLAVVVTAQEHFRALIEVPAGVSIIDGHGPERGQTARLAGYLPSMTGSSTTRKKPAPAEVGACV